MTATCLLPRHRIPVAEAGRRPAKSCESRVVIDNRLPLGLMESGYLFWGNGRYAQSQSLFGKDCGLLRAQFQADISKLPLAYSLPLRPRWASGSSRRTGKGGHFRGVFREAQILRFLYNHVSQLASIDFFTVHTIWLHCQRSSRA